YIAFHEVIIAPATEIVILFPFFEYPVVLIDLDTGVDDDHCSETVVCEFLNHLRWIGEIMFIPRKTTVTIHVVDIEVNCIAGDFTFAEVPGKVAHLTFGIVAPPALVEPEGPQ